MDELPDWKRRDIAQLTGETLEPAAKPAKAPKEKAVRAAATETAVAE